MSDQPFEFIRSINDQPAHVNSTRNYGIVHVVYLAAIGLATIGWFWFLVWIGYQLT
jgi:hypothetical protein